MSVFKTKGVGAETDPLFGTNHFTLLRWILAGAVVVGHAWLIPTGYEPSRVYDWTISYLAVNGFFILSGLLIAKSLATRQDFKGYALSRILRIYPALILLLLALLFVLGPLFGSPAEVSYFAQTEPLAYVARVLLMGDPETGPGGVFHASPDPIFNGALWTIRYEVMAYLFAGLGFYIGVLKNRWFTLAALVGSQLVYSALQFTPLAELVSGGVVSLFRFTTTFLIGMTLWHFPHLRRPGWIGAGAALVGFILLGWTSIGEPFANVFLAAALMQFGLVKTPSGRVVQMPDYSYGIYIWHYPALQSVIILNPNTSPVMLLLASAPIILICSAASWHLIEKPALKLKRVRRVSKRVPGE